MSELQPSDLLRALDAGEFEFFYQPKVSLITGLVSGCEALIRWRQQDGSYLLPGAFLPLAEESGLITEIARRMFPVLCLDQERIHDKVGDVHVAFNLENGEMVDLILEAVHTGLLSPQRLQIELTETAVAENQDALMANVELLVGAGLALAMDDFGTGYSSLDTLHQLPFSVVKIDQGVVKRLLQSSRCAAITMASIRMAHEMGLTVVAEGVESEDVFDYLHHAGCTEAQGYWLCRPKPLEEAIRFMQEGRCWCEFPIGLLRNIEMDHLQWRKAVMDRVLGLHAGGPSPNGACLDVGHSECHLGKWYYGPGQAYVGDPMFDCLAAPHRRLHEVGARLIQAAEEGRLPGYAMRSMSRELHQRSEDLLRMLQDLEIQAMLSQRAGQGEPQAA